MNIILLFSIFLLHIVSEIIWIPPYWASMIVTATGLVAIATKYTSKQQDKKTESEQPPPVTNTSAYLFPFVASFFLLSFYFLYKYLPPEYINALIKCYVTLVATISLVFLIHNILSQYLPKQDLSKQDEDSKTNTINKELLTTSSSTSLAVHKSINIFHQSLMTVNFGPLLSIIDYFEGKNEKNEKKEKIKNVTNDKNTDDINLTTSHSFSDNSNVSQDVNVDDNNNRIVITPILIIAVILSGCISIWYFLTGSILSHNILAIALVLRSIPLIPLDSIKTAIILLCGFFIYDIFWVYGTDVMVTVAVNFDAPVKLLFPRVNSRASLLGLGDMILPGVYIAMMSRFDQENNLSKSPYHISSLIGYFLGLITTVIVMIIFEHGQPALLFLVPGILGGSFLCALFRKEVKKLFNYNVEEQKQD